MSDEPQLPFPDKIENAYYIGLKWGFFYGLSVASLFYLLLGKF